MSRGAKLTTPEEVLLRQVHPSFINAGRVSSQAFRPTPKDNGELSVSAGSKTTPAAAFKLHTVDKGLESVGVWSVTVADCSILALEAFEDPIQEPIADPAHAVMDFNGLSGSRIRTCSQVLQRAAVCQYKATPPE